LRLWAVLTSGSELVLSSDSDFSCKRNNPSFTDSEKERSIRTAEEVFDISVKES
jgi:hypothetical protein